MSICTCRTSFQFHIGTLTFYNKMKKVMCRDGTKTKETKESNKTSTCHVKQSVEKKTIMTDVAINLCVCRTLILTPHSHIDFFVLAKVNGEQHDISHTHINNSIVNVISCICLIIVFNSTCPHWLFCIFLKNSSRHFQKSMQPVQDHHPASMEAVTAIVMVTARFQGVGFHA